MSVRPKSFFDFNGIWHVGRVSLKHDGTASLVADGTDYKDGTAIQLLVEQTGQPLYRRDSYVDV